MPTAERTSLVLVATKTSKKGVWRSNSSIYLTHRDGRYPAFPDSACKLPWLKNLMIRSRLLEIGEEYLSERSDG